MSVTNDSSAVAEQPMNEQQPPPTASPDQGPGQRISGSAAKSLAVLRIGLGFIFLWAFFDKAFGFSYATPSAKAWISGGSPTNGFLSSVEVGPFQSVFNSIAGSWWADLIFMVGLLGIGAALMLGVALRIAAVSGAVMMAGMWLAEFPIARFTSTGEANGSSNPFVDYHVIYALALVAVALCYAGNTWGLGKVWARVPVVSQHNWMR